MLCTGGGRRDQPHSESYGDIVCGIEIDIAVEVQQHCHRLLDDIQSRMRHRDAASETRAAERLALLQGFEHILLVEVVSGGEDTGQPSENRRFAVT